MHDNLTNLAFKEGLPVWSHVLPIHNVSTFTAGNVTYGKSRNVVNGFGLDCLDFDERSYSQFARKPQPRLQISACKEKFLTN